MKSDTYQRVLAAADQLLKEGVRPTQQNVRERLGTGSATTIHRALGDWWQGLGERFAELDTRPGVPDEVVRCASELWQAALTRANDTLVAERQAVEERARNLIEQVKQEKDVAQQEMAQMRQQLDAAYTQMEAFSKDAQQLGQELRDAEKRLLEEQEEKRNYLRTIKGLEIQIKRLSEGALSLQAGPEAGGQGGETVAELREQLQKQRQATDVLTQEKRNLDLAIIQLDARYAAQGERLAEAREELLQCKRRILVLEDELKQARRRSGSAADSAAQADILRELLEAKEREVERLMSLLTPSPAGRN